MEVVAEFERLSPRFGVPQRDGEVVAVSGARRRVRFHVGRSLPCSGAVFGRSSLSSDDLRRVCEVVAEIGRSLLYWRGCCRVEEVVVEFGRSLPYLQHRYRIREAVSVLYRSSPNSEDCRRTCEVADELGRSFRVGRSSPSLRGR